MCEANVLFDMLKTLFSTAIFTVCPKPDKAVLSQKGRVRSGLLLILLFFVFAGCQDNSLLRLNKETVVPSADLKEKGNVPDDVFYSDKYEKLAVAYRHKSGSRLLAFYDTEGPKPIFYFETPYAENVFRPAFGKDLSLVYPLLIGKKWQFFVRTIFNQEPISVAEADEIHDFVMNESSLALRVLGVQKGKFGIFPPPKNSAGYKFMENIALLDGKLVFKAIRSDGQWVIISDDLEGEPYESISRLAFGAGGKIAYVARDKKGDWYSVLGDIKIKLKKKYSEIGQVFIHGNRVFFSGVLAGGQIWEIAANNQVLASNLVNPPMFLVKNDGDIAYTIDGEDGAYYVSSGDKKGPYNQIEQFIENGDGRLFIKIKDKFALWKVISEAGDESAKYTWTSKMFRDGKGNVFALGLTSSGDFDFFKFYNK